MARRTATLSAPLPALNTRLDDRRRYAAGCERGATAPFVGEMDELEISKVARPPGFDQVCRGRAGRRFGQAARRRPGRSAAGRLAQRRFGLFGVILKSVTIDGWVVIGILGIMSVVSWYVMITKFFYVNQVQKGNELFLKEWRQVAPDLTALDHDESARGKSWRTRGPEGSEAHRQFAALSHLPHRLGGNRPSHRRPAACSRSRSIQAIRASLDGGYVRENHALNDGMVFLTISIAGGPFMGLLGTVVGVMITFAAIAATGEVNISAIAPGLAAALVATVAGLLVAIPALLGYNYLVSRMKTVVERPADLHRRIRHQDGRVLQRCGIRKRC